MRMRTGPCRSAGENTTIMLRALRSAEVAGTAWLEPFSHDFRARLLALLPGAFRRAAAPPQSRPAPPASKVPATSKCAAKSSTAKKRVQALR
jgi:tRNA(Met) C34 N-acetyltransferase TmcA